MADHGAAAPAAASTEDDPLLWFEDVDGARALAWVRAENAITGRALRRELR
jgi:prolyl oligopeptidase